MARVLSALRLSRFADESTSPARQRRDIAGWAKLGRHQLRHRNRRPRRIGWQVRTANWEPTVQPGDEARVVAQPRARGLLIRAQQSTFDIASITCGRCGQSFVLTKS